MTFVGKDGETFIYGDAMTIIKTVLVGICGALLTAFLLVAVTVIVLYLQGFRTGTVTIASRRVLAAAVFGFILGVVWMRRVRQQPQ
jgi:hypothetical protein